MTTCPKDGNQLAVDFIRNLKFENVPEAVRRRAKVCLLDLVGACLAGASARGADILLNFCLSQFAGSPEATVIRAGRKLSCAAAALVNGFIANALDIDDGYRPIKGHPGAAVFPAILAVAEKRGSGGREFLEALIIAYEIATRAGGAIQAHYNYFHSSGAWGAMGAAAGVARLLGLPATQIESALGIAEFHAPLTPVMRSVRQPAMAKDGTAWGAMVGTSAALLAGQGYTASPSLLGEREFRQAMSSLGEEYTILKLYFKPYPCCRWAQPSIEAVLRLKNEHRLQAEAIIRITIHTFPEAAALSREPPLDLEQAEYNICYPVAAAAALGDFDPTHLAQASFHNPQVLAMMDRIDVVIDPDIERQFPGKCLSEVEIATAPGGVYRSGVISARGDWDNPLSIDEMEEKFLRITGQVLPVTNARRLLALIRDFENRTVADIIPFLR